MFDVTTYEAYRLAYARYLGQLQEQPRKHLWSNEQWDRHELLRLCNELQERHRTLERQVTAYEERLMLPLPVEASTVA